MKKNKMMRVASALLVAVLMTTSVISGTFAKYVTQDSANDSARVAKWGVELQVMGNLYGEKYNTNAAADNKDGIVASSTNISATTDVVAPGTKNENGLSVSLRGTPEVAGKISAVITVQNIFLAKNTYAVMVPVPNNIVTKENYNEMKAELFIKSGDTFVAAPTTWDDDYTGKFYTCEDKLEDTEFSTNAKYYPVKYNLTGDLSYTSDSVYVDTLGTIVTSKLAGIFGGLTADSTIGEAKTKYTTTTPVSFDANTVLDSLNYDFSLKWAWAFGTADDPATFADKADTILGLIGNTSANATVVKLDTDGTTYVAPTPYTDYCLNTMFDISITVEQVD